MATVQRPEERYVDFDEYIDLQLDKARNGIKWTDILAAAAGVGALVVAYLVLFVIADHWLFEGGIPTGLRQILLSAVGVVAIAWIGWKVVWPYMRRVNDLYAAQMLERAEPSLRGNLFGLVDSRRAGRPPIEEVRRALERRAATTLSDVDVDAALDRRLLMRMSYFLLGVVLVACVYAIASPKRVGPSLLRALLPSSNIGVATRTEILDVRPGDTTVLAGEQLTVSTMIRGETPERVMLFYSTADRRFVDEPVELRLVDETTREYQATLIGDAGRGLAQDLSYRIVANDDSAGPFAIEVDQPPAANIKTIALQYPPYTGLEPAERETPPVEGIEGTNIVLTALANRPLRSAKLVFADDELFRARGEEVPLRISDDGLTLTASWKLAIRSDGSSPTFFRIECRDKSGKANPKPAVYPVKIYADAAPEVTLHDPKSDLERPANAIIPLLVTARDPDFRLRELTLRIEKRGQELPDRTVLWEGSAPEAAVRHDWDLGPLALKPGDIVSFYVQARDNREPEANRRNTPKLNIKITEPVAKEDVQRQLEEEKKRQEEEIAELEQNAAGADAEPQPIDEPLETAESEAEKTHNDQQQQDDNADGSDEPQEGAEGAAPNEGNEPSNDAANERDSSVKNDGTQDDKVLRKLLERQRQQQQQQNADEAGEQQDQSASEKSEPNDADPSQQGEKQGGPGEKGNKSDGSPKGGDQRQEVQPGDQSEQADGANGPEKRDQPQNGKPNGESSEQAGNKGGDNRPQSAADRRSEPNKDQTGDGRAASGNKRDANSNQEQKSAAAESNDTGTAGSESPQGEGNAGQNATAKGAPQDQNEKSATGEGTSTPMESGDSERSDTKPRSSQSNDEPAGTAEPNPGEGQPDQKSQKPGSGEQGTSQRNVDGTPDGQKGPGDAGTKPGSQQESNDATGQSGVKATEKGRPGEGTSEQAKGGTPSEKQTSDAQKGESTSKTSDEAQPSDTNGEERENGTPSDPSQKSSASKPSQESNQQPASQQKSDMPSDQSSNNAKSNSNQNAPTANDSSQSDSGEGKSGEGKSGEGKSGEGQSGEGKSGEGQSGEGKSGEGKSGEGKSGEGQSGKGEAGKGEAGGAGGQTGESGAPGQQGGKSGQPGGKPGIKGGEGGGAAAAGSADGGTAEGEGAGDGSPPESTAEEANPEYTKQATDLALKKLEDDLARGEVDPELLKQLGWTEDDMRRFADRLRKNLDAPKGDETPQEIAHRKEFEHMLENLTIESTPQAREGRNDRVRNVEGVGTKRPPIPSAYRDAYETFTRRVANRKATSTAPADTKKP